MWRSIALIVTILVGLGAADVRAESKPLVVVELFTSQGCSSCPPADKLLHELAKRSDVLALGLHVDYWDYIGWKDVFGKAAYSDRQRAYAHVGGRGSVYTPQMIVQGQQHVVGTRPSEVKSLINRHSGMAPPVALKAKRSGTRVTITAQASAGKRGEAAVVLVRYIDEGTTEIKRGELAGHKMSYANVVTELKVLKVWDMKAPLELKANIKGNERAAILIQTRGHGPILAAARAD